MFTVLGPNDDVISDSLIAKLSLVARPGYPKACQCSTKHVYSIRKANWKATYESTELRPTNTGGLQCPITLNADPSASFTSSSCTDYTVIRPCIVIISHVIPSRIPLSPTISTECSTAQVHQSKKKKGETESRSSPLSVLLCHHIPYINVPYIHTGTSINCWHIP